MKKRWKTIPYGCKKHQNSWIDGNPINKTALRMKVKQEIQKQFEEELKFWEKGSAYFLRETPEVKFGRKPILVKGYKCFSCGFNAKTVEFDKCPKCKIRLKRL